jgi:hypothetical protein
MYVKGLLTAVLLVEVPRQRGSPARGLPFVCRGGGETVDPSARLFPLDDDVVTFVVSREPGGYWHLLTRSGPSGSHLLEVEPFRYDGLTHAEVADVLDAVWHGIRP